MRIKFFSVMSLVMALGLISSCQESKKAPVEAAPIAVVSGADSIAKIDANLSFMDIHLGQVFKKEEWAKAHQIDCSEDGSEELRNIFRMYRFIYLPQRIKVKVCTLADNTVYEITVYRFDSVAQELWDSCYNEFGGKYATKRRYQDLMRTCYDWKYKNQTVSIYRNANVGTEVMSITYTDIQAKKKMEEAREQARKNGQVVH